jgi:CheY-like chemotaxis protein
MKNETASGKTILFVDDDEISNFVSVKTIEDADIAENIVSVTSAQEALEMINKGLEEDQHNNIPDLIFLDINMPVMSGWDFLEEYRKIKSTIKKRVVIIILTSSVYQQDKEKASTYQEVDDYTLKPLNISDLMIFRDKYLK